MHCFLLSEKQRLIATMNSITLRKQYSRVLTVWLGVIISGSLLNSNLFFYPSLTPYFFFTTATAGLCLFTVITGWRAVGDTRLGYTVPLALLLLPACYIAIHGLVFSGGFNTRHWNLLFLLLLIILLAWHFKKGTLCIQRLHQWISYIAVAEALVCLLQLAGMLPSLNIYFTVTGTWTNPNVTAMFLAVCIPGLLQLLLTSHQTKRKLYLLMMVLIGFAILVLRCRTALLGGGVAAAWMLLRHYPVICWFNNRSKLQQLLLILLLAGTLVVTAAGLYRVKKASADARLAVWKTSLALVAQQPLTGYGYGSFEAAYNRFKIRHHSTGIALPAGNTEDAHVFMAYNEFIENAVEGGVTGLICLVLFFAGLFFFSFKTPSLEQAIVCQAALLAFLVMCCFNFTLQAIPVMCVLAVHAAFIVAGAPVLYLSKKAFPANWLPIRLAVLTLSAYLLLYQVSVVKANYQNKLAAAENKKGHFEQALQLLEGLEGRLSAYESYWRNYAATLYSLHRYQQAAVMLEKATQLTAHPDLYMQLGLCYQQANRITEAEQCFITAQCIAPDRLRPRALLMLLYQQQKDFSRACYTASQLLAITPKVPSAQALHYKEQAQKILHRQ